MKLPKNGFPRLCCACGSLRTYSYGRAWFWPPDLPRLRDILDPMDFKDLVAGLQQYRAREMSVEDLVVHAGDCLYSLQVSPVPPC